MVVLLSMCHLIAFVENGKRAVSILMSHQLLFSSAQPSLVWIPRVGGIAKIIVMIHHLLCLQPRYSLLNAISSHHLNSQMPSYTCFLNFSGQCRQERDAVVKLKLSICEKSNNRYFWNIDISHQPISKPNSIGSLLLISKVWNLNLQKWFAYINQTVISCMYIFLNLRDASLM